MIRLLHQVQPTYQVKREDAGLVHAEVSLDTLGLLLLGRVFAVRLLHPTQAHLLYHTL